MVLKDETPFFDVWMYHINDDIQSCALAFGERYFLQNAIDAMEDNCSHKGAKSIMFKAIFLHMITLLNENMSWYLKRGYVSKQAAKALSDGQASAVKIFAPHMNDCIEAFGLVMKPEFHAPIARNYVRFNS